MNPHFDIDDHDACGPNRARRYSNRVMMDTEMNVARVATRTPVTSLRQS
jgi:hypothetical protein